MILAWAWAPEPTFLVLSRASPIDFLLPYTVQWRCIGRYYSGKYPRALPQLGWVPVAVLILPRGTFVERLAESGAVVSGSRGNYFAPLAKNFNFEWREWMNGRQ